MQRPDPSQLRISDDDRHKVAEILREAAGDGRIDLSELDERLQATYAAKTYGDLVPITADLPAHRTTPGLPTQPTRSAQLPVPADTYANSFVIMGSTKRQGAWLCPETSTAFALMGEVILDLREATLASKQVTIQANAIMGSVKIIVDAHTHVRMDGTPLMGDFKQARDKVEPALDQDSPTVLVKGMALMGEVSVQRLPRPGTPKKFLGNY